MTDTVHKKLGEDLANLILSQEQARKRPNTTDVIRRMLASVEKKR